MSVNPSSFAEVIHRLASENRRYAIATVVKVEGSSIGKPGFKMVIDEDGSILYGTLGGVCPEGPIIEIAKETMGTGIPRLVRVYLESVESSLEGMVKQQSPDEIHVETFCGGVMEIFVEPFTPPRRLVLVAQGGKDDVEEALIKMGRILGFEVWAVDPLPMLREKPDRLISDLRTDLRALGLGDRDYVVVLTKGARDIQVLEELSQTNVAFIGLVASGKRASHDLELLRERGVPEGFLSRISAPVGADIGAYTPEEIALSILAEIVAMIRGKQVPRKGRREPERAAARAAGEASVYQEIGSACAPESSRGA